MHFSNYAKLYCDIVYFWKDNSVFWQIFRPIMRNRRGESEPSFTCIETKAFSWLCQSLWKHPYLKSCARGVIDPWYITRCRRSRKLRRLMETRQTSLRVFTLRIKPTVVNPTCLFRLSSYLWQNDEREHKQKPFSTFRKLGMWLPPEERWLSARMATMHREESLGLSWSQLTILHWLTNWLSFFQWPPTFH